MNPKGWTMRALWVAALAAGSSASAQDERPPSMDLIDAAGLKRHAEYLASDELGGRYTGSLGQQKAAEYIAEVFGQLGLDPLGDKRRGKPSYFQAWPVHRTALDMTKTGITVGDQEFAVGFAVIAGESKRKLDLRGKIAFCGYGAQSEIPRGSLKRSIPVVELRGASGPRAGMVGAIGLRKAAAIHTELERRGARAVLYVVRDDGTADTLNYQAMLPDKPIVRYGKKPDRSSAPWGKGPAVFVSAKIGDALLAHIGVGRDGVAFDTTEVDTKASGRVRVALDDDKKAKVFNVVGSVPGTDKAAEAVVFSAHMDHMGVRVDGDAFNGADDNASGTAGLLEIAEAFARGERPERSVLFLAVCGEEEGLWGSHWFSEHPTWPIGRIVADVNIDMIGRSTSSAGSDQVAVTPTFRHGEYSTMVQDASKFAATLGLSLTSADVYYQRSDHYNFARKGVPVVFFTNGEHADYHKVSDEVDKLDFAKMETVARLAYWTGYAVAQSGRPRPLGKQRGW